MGDTRAKQVKTKCELKSILNIPYYKYTSILTV